MKIYFISAKGCKKCDDIRSNLEHFSSYYDIQVWEIDSEDIEAITIALDNGIDDIPGVAIGDYAVSGEHITMIDIKGIIKKALKG